jgi:hypothetical protein
LFFSAIFRNRIISCPIVGILNGLGEIRHRNVFFLLYWLGHENRCKKLGGGERTAQVACRKRFIFLLATSEYEEQDSGATD